MRRTTIAVGALLGILALSAGAQDSIFENRDFAKIYTASREATLAGAAEKVTVQQPATNSGLNFFFDGAAVYCSVDCVVTIERNGTAATTTAFTPVALNPGIVASKAQALHTSNVGAGTSLGVYRVPAGSEKVIGLRGLRLRPGSRDNLTVKTDAITGTVRILLKWAEVQP